jgi:chaperone modulatory protein CbpM
MSTAIRQPIQGLIVEEEILLSLSELCQACHAREEQITVWVMEGVLEPIGNKPDEWCFAGHSLRRARLALRLAHDLEVNTAGVALALDLMDEIADLKVQLRRLSGRG